MLMDYMLRVGTLEFRMIAPSFWLINWMDEHAIFIKKRTIKGKTGLWGKIKNSLLDVYY